MHIIYENGHNKTCWRSITNDVDEGAHDAHDVYTSREKSSKVYASTREISPLLLSSAISNGSMTST